MGVLYISQRNCPHCGHNCINTVNIQCLHRPHLTPPPHIIIEVQKKVASEKILYLQLLVTLAVEHEKAQ